MKGNQQIASESHSSETAREPVDSFTSRQQAVIEQLRRAYLDRRPAAILTGVGRGETSEVIGAFLTSVADDATIVKVNKPKSSAVEGMREIIRGIGFEPCDMNRSDLEKVFELFLSFQQKHRKRTILDIEQAQDQANWLLDHVSRLVEMESTEHYGLMVLLSGQPDLRQLIHQPPLEAVREQAGRQIALQRLSFDETRDLIRSRVEGTTTSDIAELFEYPAITAIHELSHGIADEVERLYRQSLYVGQQADRLPVTTQFVMRAKQQLDAEAEADTLADTMDLPIITEPVEAANEPIQRLVARHKDKVIHEYPVRRGRMLVGRDRLCDVKLPSKLVSRHHALFVRDDKEIHVLDLGSTNGTYVNDRKVRDHALADGDIVRIADCSIEVRLG